MSELVEKVSIPLDEQETIINIRPNQVEERVNVYTSMYTTLTQLWKLQEEHPDELLVVNDDKYGTEFSVPRKWIKIKPPKKYSEEQKARMAENLAKVRGKQ